jgi:ABC-type uncharacterized transport systems, ATPase components
MRNISKHFGNLDALSNVSLELRRGSVHALLGENGAGKTTLMRIVFGMVNSDTGDIRVDGVTRKIRSPADAISAGIGMVHQHLMLAQAMNVAENVELGGHGTYSPRTAADKVHKLGKKTGLILDPLAKVSSLGIAAQQRLEIIKVLARDARILILDEPTAVLAPIEAQNLLGQIRSLVLDGSTSVVLITHKLRDAQQYADYVSVLRHGRLILHGPMVDYTEDSLAKAMLGKPLESLSTSMQVSVGKPVISLRDVGVILPGGIRNLQNVNIQVRAGEIVGLAALEGAATHLLRVLAGRYKPTEGTAELPSRIGFVPENRLQDALVPAFSLYENVALKDTGKRRGRMHWASIRKTTTSLLARFDVRANDINASIRDLSGGNQQKFVLARELGDSPSALITENPTRGLDIQSASMIHQQLREAAKGGCAILFYSSDIDELVALAHRVVVVRDGQVVPVALHPQQIGNALLRSARLSTE